jgi:hypothetical protein
VDLHTPEHSTTDEINISQLQPLLPMLLMLTSARRLQAYTNSVPFKTHQININSVKIEYYGIKIKSEASSPTVLFSVPAYRASRTEVTLVARPLLTTLAQ